MIEILKKNLKLIITYFSVLFCLVISMCFSTFIDAGLYGLLYTKDHIIANNKLLIHFINVGQADAVAINFPNGQVALIDAGSEYSANELLIYLRSYVLPISNGKIDYLFYTHADYDHTGGMKSILYNYEVKNIIRPRQYASFETLESGMDSYVKNSDSYDETMTYVYEEVNGGANLIKAEDLLTFNVGGVSLKIFYPEVSVQESNSFSYFLRVEYNDMSALFTGDVDEESEKLLTRRHENIDCDILKVAHHGSNTSSCLDFVNAVTPQYSVISVGKNNYGHPSQDVVNRLNSVNSQILRTDLNGNILFCIDDGIKVHYNKTFYISLIKFSYLQLAWCICVVLICYGSLWVYNQHLKSSKRGDINLSNK